MVATFPYHTACYGPSHYKFFSLKLLAYHYCFDSQQACSNHDNQHICHSHPLIIAVISRYKSYTIIKNIISPFTQPSLQESLHQSLYPALHHPLYLFTGPFTEPNHFTILAVLNPIHHHSLHHSLHPHQVHRLLPPLHPFTSSPSFSIKQCDGSPHDHALC